MARWTLSPRSYERINKAPKVEVKIGQLRKPFASKPRASRAIFIRVVWSFITFK
jgi:hypothetical protein